MGNWLSEKRKQNFLAGQTILSANLLITVINPHDVVILLLGNLNGRNVLPIPEVGSWSNLLAKVALQS